MSPGVIVVARLWAQALLNDVANSNTVKIKESAFMKVFGIDKTMLFFGVDGIRCREAPSSHCGQKP